MSGGVMNVLAGTRGDVWFCRRDKHVLYKFVLIKENHILTRSFSVELDSRDTLRTWDVDVSRYAAVYRFEGWKSLEGTYPWFFAVLHNGVK